MAYWLVKTEPSEYSFGDLVRDRRTVWNGVKNALALKHLRAMEKGDLVFVYHAGSEKSIVGIAEVVSRPRPDPGQDRPSLTVVDLRPVQSLVHPVPVAAVKARREFADFSLVRLPRLSVMPVTGTQWRSLLMMSH
jgi:predicted RNA-binding protein with PUA-like domain